MRFEDLRQHYPPIPPAMEEALVQQVRGLKEDHMKRKMPLALAVALALVLLAGTVTAINYMSSIRGWLPKDKQDQITLINDHHENQWMALDINDAYTDGARLYLALHMAHKEGAAPVYVFPQVFATSQEGKQYVGDVEMGFELIDGVWLPELYANENGPGNYAVDMVLYSREGEQTEHDIQLDGPITWTTRFHVLRLAPGWRMAHRPQLPEDRAQISALIQAAHRDKLLILSDDDLAMEFLDYGPLPEGMSEQDYFARPTWQRLMDCGAMEAVDTFERQFSTP